MSFTHMVLGANDLEKSRAFYDAVLAPLGMKRSFDTDKRTGWSNGGPQLMVGMPINGEPATHANGGTVGLAAADKAAVDAFHAAGIAAGGVCDGAPGPRPAVPNCYGAYLRDPAGNKICAIAFNVQL